MTIQAVVVDIDGTMTDYGRRLDLDGVKAIRKAEANGIPVLAATGNVAPVTKAFSNYVGLTGPAICENGGVIYDADFRRRRILASRRHADRAVRHLHRRGFRPRLIASDPWRLSEVALELTLDEEAVRRELAGWRLRVVSTRFALHIMEPNLDKANSLRIALDYLPRRVAPKNILAIGDSHNDVGLFQACGQSAAPSNCTDSIRAVAGYVSKKKHGQGVQDALRHFGVI